MTVLQRRVHRAWKILENRTPLQDNCGNLCASACCKGEANVGMRVLPGEEALLTSDDFILKTGENGKYCICSSRCQREMRPFACRIFPYFPIPVRFRSGRYAVHVMPDIRALGLCPLLRNENVEINRYFLHAVRRAGRELLKSRHTREWLLDSADEIRSTALLQQRLNVSPDTVKDR